MAITVTEQAEERIYSILCKRQTPEHWLRIAVRGGGCSGFKYDYSFVTEPEERDKKFEFTKVKICIDSKSYLFLNGIEIDFEETLMKAGLVFNNPKAKRTCGCGESISF